MHWPYSMVVIGSREKRGVGEEFVGSYLYQVHLYRCIESNDYGRLLSGNNAYIKVKRNFCGAQVRCSSSRPRTLAPPPRIRQRKTPSGWSRLRWRQACILQLENSCVLERQPLALCLAST